MKVEIDGASIELEFDRPIGVPPAEWLAARRAYPKWAGKKVGSAVHDALLDHVYGKKEHTDMNEPTQDDKLKGALFEVEELRTEVSNLNDELSEVRVERETLRASLERATKEATDAKAMATTAPCRTSRRRFVSSRLARSGCAVSDRVPTTSRGSKRRCFGRSATRATRRCDANWRDRSASCVRAVTPHPW